MARKGKVSVNADVNVNAKGMKNATKESKKLRDNLRHGETSSDKIAKNMSRTRTGRTAMDHAGMSRTSYGGARGVTGGTGRAGKDFSNMAQMGGGTGGLVAAYAMLAANIFALTAAFQALSNAAKVEQLTQGLELMGARSGIALKVTANGLKEITDNAISTSDAMRAVAQASSAGLGQDEIERLGGVARGAALALGRDTSEALDRLTRGAIKLEPELLDELGIMVRLDEAVQAYAKANGLTASSLTLTQKRQAFLNAVLEEGESKFSDINKQIASNSFDKLSASVRDFGTDILKTLNNVVIPFIQVLTEVPVLGLALALGVLQKSMRQVLPNIESQLARTTGRVDIARAKARDFRAPIKEARTQYRQAAAGSIEQIRAEKELNRLIKRRNQLNQNVLFQQQKMRLEEKMLQTAKTKGYTLARAQYAIDLARLRVARQQNKEQAKANMLTAIGIGLSKIKGITMAAVGALSSLFAIITIISAAVAGIIFLYKKFFPPTEAQKRLKLLKDELKELNESARETRNQLDSMKVGAGYDALVNSTGQIVANLEKQLRVQRQIEQEAEDRAAREELTRQRNSLQRRLRQASRGRGRGRGTDTDSYREGQRELARLNAELERMREPIRLQNAIEGLSGQAKEAYENIKLSNPELLKTVNSLLEAGAAQEEITLEIINAANAQEKFLNLNKDIVEGTKLISEGFAEIRFKDIDNDFTKIGNGFKQIQTRLEQLPDMPSQMQLGAVKEGLESIGKAQTFALLDTAVEIGVDIAPRDVVKVRQYFYDLDKLAEIELKLKDVDLPPFIRQIYEQAQESVTSSLTDTSVEVAEIATSAAEAVQERFDAEKTTLETLKMQVGINKAILATEKSRLNTAHKIADIRAGVVGISLKEDKIIKSITAFTRENQELALAVRNTSNEIDALEEGRLTLILQRNQAEEDGQNKTVAHLNTVIAKNADLRREKEAQLRQELQAQQDILKAQGQALVAEFEALKLSQTENSLLKNNQDITFTTIRAEEIRLENVQRQIQFKKQELQLTTNIANKQRQLARVQAEGRAAQRGFGGLSAAQEREFKRADLQAQLDNFRAQEELLEQEKQAALDKLKMENELFKLRFAAAELALQNSIIEGKEKGLDVTEAEQVLGTMQAQNIQSILQNRYTTEEEMINSTFGKRAELLEAERNLIEGMLNNLGDANTAFQNLGASLLRTSEGFNLPDQTRGVFLSERQAVIDDMATGKLSQEEGDEKIRQLREQASAMGALEIAAEGVNNVLNTVQSSMEEAFMSMIDGSKSAAEAFGDMAKAILKDIAQMIVKMLVYKAIEAGLNMIPGVGPGLSAGFRALTGSGAAGGYMEKGAAGGIMGYANGGIIKPRDGLEGIVKQPTYLVGEGRMNEAVVPLPNGRSIPVQMHGGNTSSQQNNVSVTVNMGDGSTTTNAGSGDQAQRMGQMIAAAVQKELMAQKSPGGLLSKYG